MAFYDDFLSDPNDPIREGFRRRVFAPEHLDPNRTSLTRETFTPRAVQQARRLQGMVQPEGPPTTDQVGVPTLSAVGDVSQGRSPSFLRRLGGLVQSDRFSDALTGAAPFVDPTADGVEGFAGSAIRGFLGARGAGREREEAQAKARRDAEDRALARQNTESQIADRLSPGQGTQARPLLIEGAEGGPIEWDPSTRSWRRVMVGDQPARMNVKPTAEVLQTWQREGYDSFEAWRKDRMASGERPVEGERRAAGLLVGARAALADVEGALNRGFSPNAEPAVSQAVSLLFNNGTWRNALASPLGQEYYTAVERLYNNYLYTVSGAQVPPSEIANQARQATVAFFDAPGTREQKMRTLRGKLQEMEVIGGRAVQGSAPSTPQAPVTRTPPPVP